jgi:hypothetical protein
VISRSSVVMALVCCVHAWVDSNLKGKQLR